MAPSELLTRAADLIRDTAAAATPGPWEVDGPERDIRAIHSEDGAGVVMGARDPVDEASVFNTNADARWIALMSPAVAGPAERLLREAAESAARHVPVWQNSSVDGFDGPKRTDAEVADLVEHHYGPALALARAVLGEKEETDGR